MGAQTNTQRSFSNLSKSLPTLKHLFDHDPFTNKPFGLTNIALQDEILSMVSFCSSMALSTTSHELKRFKLTHLFTVIKTSKKPLHHDVLSSVMSLISVNIFRPLPPPSPAFPITSTLAEENEVVVSSTLPSLNWLLLELVYEILLWLVINIDTQTLEKHIDHTFLLGLLSLFDSEEAKERESLKNVFHQIYYKLTKYRSFMRKAMSGVFLEYIFETERHNGIAEMLEIWGSIINGFAVPLKEEHKVFLKRILIPLHKVKGMQNFNKQLGYCVYQFVEKESELGGFIVRKIMKYWPQANSQKEIKLIEELEDLVEKLDPKLYRDLALPFCSHMTKCFKSLNSMVAERSLYMWSSEAFVTMVSTAMEEVFPVILRGMENIIRSHWNENVKELARNVKVILQEMNPILYHKTLHQNRSKQFKATQINRL
ncbi:serine/threonine protein phosphatase 2A 57 kDa regulatory subunit B' beta isoform-like [Cucumis melo var. makuwa]|uniref:Serine/threonine protein phosphatase 2A 57 kDa regulatory subunit B' beta isoform-like n=2 Tax=Cucumis melo TaxID=3656 RepID=A0A5D3BMH4_CUCMM|nr:serine/threonine protein phosphatase 2A 57 kDa regulatory subunit B' beta isoform-like [Cucumis melo var. makuwa]TYJ99525.1 serine/threonine protein phosphatase 2A 57 kDa regulatory subunit B' beta isoform-like [Cucumis melo var. makuwa]